MPAGCQSRVAERAGSFWQDKSQMGQKAIPAGTDLGHRRARKTLRLVCRREYAAPGPKAAREQKRTSVQRRPRSRGCGEAAKSGCAAGAAICRGSLYLPPPRPAPLGKPSPQLPVNPPQPLALAGTSTLPRYSQLFDQHHPPVPPAPRTPKAPSLLFLVPPPQPLTPFPPSLQRPLAQAGPRRRHFRP